MPIQSKSQRAPRQTVVMVKTDKTTQPTGPRSADGSDGNELALLALACDEGYVVAEVISDRLECCDPGRLSPSSVWFFANAEEALYRQVHEACALCDVNDGGIFVPTFPSEEMRDGELASEVDDLSLFYGVLS